MVIKSFKGEYKVFSNMDEHPIKFNGLTYRNSEACFQAQKCSNNDERLAFTSIDGYTAKKLGRRIKCDMKAWHEVRDYIMFAIQIVKFKQYEEFRTKLLSTGDAEIIEGNDHGDSYWGVNNSTGNGLNKLGKILMVIRDLAKGGAFHARVVDTPVDTIVERVKSGYFKYDPPSELNMGLAEMLFVHNAKALLRVVVVLEPDMTYTIAEGAEIIAVAIKVYPKFAEVLVGFIPVIHTNRHTYDFFKSIGTRF